MEWTFSDSVRLSLLSFSEASKACAALPGFSLFRRSLQPERIEYCRAELLPDCLVGSLAVPDKTHPLHLAFSLAFYLDRGQLILAADEQTLPALQSLLFPEEPLDTSDVFHLFFSFLESLIQEDMLYLQNFEKRLATIEEYKIRCLWKAPGDSGAPVLRREVPALSEAAPVPADRHGLLPSPDSAHTKDRS